MMGKVAGAVASAVGLLLLAIVAGAGNLAQAKPPAGGCAVSPGTGNDAGGGGAGDQRHAELNAAQMAVARQIVGVGKGMGVTARGTAIALGTAMQESTLDPLATSPGGRSVGLFQQQGSLYAGVNRTDPVDSSAAFYRMLLQRVPGYADPQIPFAQAAQTVQASGAGAAWYARWEQWATALAGELYSGAPAVGTGHVTPVQCTPGGGSGPIAVTVQGTRVFLPEESGWQGVIDAPTPQAAAAIAAGLSYLGADYAWGGGSPTGPSRGIRDGGVADAHGDFNKVGFDCAGLTQYAWAQAGVTLTRPAASQLSNGRKVPFSQAQPGDLLFWGATPHHVAIYLGDGGTGDPIMLEAPQSGDHVKISPVRTGGDFLDTAVRPS